MGRQVERVVTHGGHVLQCQRLLLLRQHLLRQHLLLLLLRGPRGAQAEQAGDLLRGGCGRKHMHGGAPWVGEQLKGPRRGQEGQLGIHGEEEGVLRAAGSVGVGGGRG